METRWIIGICVGVFVILVLGWLLSAPSIAGSYKVVHRPGDIVPTGSEPILVIESTGSTVKIYESTKPDRYEIGTQSGSADIVLAPPPGNGGLGPGIKKLTKTATGIDLTVSGPGGIPFKTSLARV